MTVRVRFAPRNFIDLDDEAEVAALAEALVIRRDTRDPKGLTYGPFAPWVTRESVHHFLLGRRHALGQSLRSLQVSSQSYEERLIRTESVAQS